MNHAPALRSRIKVLNKQGIQAGDYVLYWMQASQRSEDNYALEYAIGEANTLAKPVLVVFGLMDDYPEANLRHYQFMLEGLKEVQQGLQERKIKLLVQLGSPEKIAHKLAMQACLVVTDKGYLRLQRQWRNFLAEHIPCKLVEVEDNVVVPVDLASNKAEFAARTLRPKILRQLSDFLLDLQPNQVQQSSLDLSLESLDLSKPEALCQSLKLDKSVTAVSSFFKGGSQEAKHTLQTFLRERFENYAANRNQPHTNDTSHMAMYLHFGQISPIYIALKAKEAQTANSNSESFLEELIIRRELAMNFCHFNDNYDSYDVLPLWARQTLAKHLDDPREPGYTLEQLENAQTHDPYWNAAMNEMRFSGYMHNYMRMYWGKKILEWTPDPKEAFYQSLYLNNKYFLDGRDANSFTGVAWCYGLHDRPWTERRIFGTVRYMNARGLERKTKPDAYVQKVNRLMAKAKGEQVETPEQGHLF